MGVDKRDYFVYGWKIKYQRDYDENDKYEDYRCGKDGVRLSLIVDGMSGKYMVWGIVLAEADEYEGFDFLEIDINLKDLHKELMQEIKKVELKFDTEPKLLLFSHFS